MEKERLHTLLAKYLDQSLTADECGELFTFIENSKTDTMLEAFLLEQWEQLTPQNIFNTETSKRMLTNILSDALPKKP